MGNNISDRNVFNRRDFLGLAGYGALACGSAMLAGCSGFAKNFAQNQRKPNVILILADDLGRAEVSCYKDTWTRETLPQEGLEHARASGYDLDKALEAALKYTPNIDRIAAAGVRMTNIHMAPSCAPSRAALMSGRYPQRGGIYRNGDIYHNGFPDSEYSLVNLLRENGYSTALVGKWHLGRKREKGASAFNYIPEKHPMSQGFDHFWGFDAAETTYYDSKDLWSGRTLGAKPEGYLTDQLTKEAIKYIDNNSGGGKPFFLYLAYNAPHGPIARPPQEYLEPFDLGNEMMNNIAGTIHAMDKGIGDVMEHLKKLNIDKDTLVLFASDNGAPFGHPLPSNGNLKGYKRQYYEGGIRAPLIARWPGRLPQGVSFNQMASVMDILPTVLDAAGIDVPRSFELDGRSLLPVLTGRERSLRQSLCWAGPNGRYSISLGQYKKKAAEMGVSHWDILPAGWYVRKGDWKLIEPSSGKPELYNLADDIEEENNLIAEYPELAEELKGIFRQWISEMPPPVLCNVAEWEKFKEI
jgi:uncharacterized sulfatase